MFTAPNPQKLAGFLAGILCLTGLCLPASAAGESDSAGGPAITVEHAILVECSSGQTLFERGADTRRAPASITKIMTMLLVMEAIEEGRISPDDTVTCSEYASSMGGSQIWLEPYEQMTVHELLKATAVASANDAAVALAEHLSGTEAAFAEEMNRRAQELGMTNTHFVNCTGLDEEEHYTTARDISIMAEALLEHDSITQYTGIWMDELRHGETQLVNTNRLIIQYPGATGLKTGSTDQAGRCLCASARRDEMELISVVLGAPDSETQFGDSRALLDWGFGNFICVPLRLPPDELSPMHVSHGVEETVSLAAVGPDFVVIPRADGKNLSYEVTLQEEVQAPVDQNQTVGNVRISVNSREIGIFPVRTQHSVARMTFGRALLRTFESLFSMHSR